MDTTRKDKATVGANPEKSYKFGKGTRAPSLWKQAETSGAVQPEVEKVVWRSQQPFRI